MGIKLHSDNLCFYGKSNHFKKTETLKLQIFITRNSKHETQKQLEPNIFKGIKEKTY